MKQTALVVFPENIHVIIISSLISLTLIFLNSINHEYKEWDEKNPQLITCNKDTKNLIQGSTVPQEVDTKKEIVFTYDVSFKVPSSEIPGILELFLQYCSCKLGCGISTGK